jgi:hypothetical protein
VQPPQTFSDGTINTRIALFDGYENVPTDPQSNGNVEYKPETGYSFRFWLKNPYGSGGKQITGQITKQNGTTLISFVDDRGITGRFYYKYNLLFNNGIFIFR